jgi:hypothetical protein
MGWRRGELWLDTELLWFREGAGVPAVASFAPAPIPNLGPPPGLVASRLRRAAWKRRRNTRRARATALVLSPAVIIALAAVRSSGDRRTPVAADDAPSHTFRVGAGRVRTAETPVDLRAGHGGVPVARPSTPATKPKRVHRSVAHAVTPSKIEWHRATSVGLPYGGSLIGGTQLPVEGPNWVTWNPVTDSVPNAPNRLYGNERTIRAIVSVTDAYRDANPGAPLVVIGDVSREGGGPMMDEHVSHQNGLDVDVYYPRLDGRLRAPVAPDEIDRRLAQDLLDRFVAAGAQVVFVGYSTGLSGPARVVIPYPRHESHMHVRFPPRGG